LGLKKDVLWKYDPYHVISDEHKGVGLPSYQDYEIASIEMISNQDRWEEVQHLFIMQNYIEKRKFGDKSKIQNYSGI
jgi:hypothetical protein